MVQVVVRWFARRKGSVVDDGRAKVEERVQQERPHRQTKRPSCASVHVWWPQITSRPDGQFEVCGIGRRIESAFFGFSSIRPVFPAGPHEFVCVCVLLQAVRVQSATVGRPHDWS